MPDAGSEIDRGQQIAQDRPRAPLGAGHADDLTRPSGQEAVAGSAVHDSSSSGSADARRTVQRVERIVPKRSVLCAATGAPVLTRSVLAARAIVMDIIARYGEDQSLVASGMRWRNNE